MIASGHQSLLQLLSSAYLNYFFSAKANGFQIGHIDEKECFIGNIDMIFINLSSG